MLLFLGSYFAGMLGTVIGLGGGVILVPLLTHVFAVDIHQAVAMSLISILMTSIAGSVQFLKQEIVDLDNAMFLASATVIGAILGVQIGQSIPAAFLSMLFGLVLLLMAFLMIYKKKSTAVDQKKYPRAAYVVMIFSGALSAILGIGAGAFKVLAMDQLLRMPLKKSTATSNLMIGMTASSSALYFIAQRKFQSEMMMPLMIGVLAGALTGSRLVKHLPEKYLRVLFVIVVTFIGLQMIGKAK